MRTAQVKSFKGFGGVRTAASRKRYTFWWQVTMSRGEKVPSGNFQILSKVYLEAMSISLFMGEYFKTLLGP
jgi:hypothetical protein